MTNFNTMQWIMLVRAYNTCLAIHARTEAVHAPIQPVLSTLLIRTAYRHLQASSSVEPKNLVEVVGTIREKIFEFSKL